MQCATKYYLAGHQIDTPAVTHLFFYFRLLAFLLLNVANKIADGNPLKAKLGICIEEQMATCVESLCKGATDHEWLRTMKTFIKNNGSRISH